MSVLERSLSAIKEVLLLRDQFKQMREEVNRMGGNIGDMLDDIRDLEQRVARLEGVEKTIMALVSRTPRLPGE
jgi:methyl-accepting chemotaxis protein